MTRLWMFPIGAACCVSAVLAQQPTHCDLVRSGQGGQAPSVLPPVPPPEPVNNVVLHDSLSMVTNCTFNTANGNTCGGPACFGYCVGLQLCDDFLVPNPGAIIAQVTGAFVACRGTDEFLYANVTFYAETFPGSCTPSEVPFCEFCAFPATIRGLPDCGFGMPVVTITVNFDPCRCSLPAGRWFVDIQPATCETQGDYYWQIRQVGLLTPCDAHLRDSFPNDLCCGDGAPGYGFSEWKSAGSAGYGEGDAAFRVVACKEEDPKCVYRVVKATPLGGPCGESCATCRHAVGDCVYCGSCNSERECPGFDTHRNRIVAYCSCPGGGMCQYTLRLIGCQREPDCPEFCP